MRYKPQSIEQIGLEKYLNETAQSHNGFTYETFCKMLGAEVSTASMARAFKVSRITIHKWQVIYEKELIKDGV